MSLFTFDSADFDVPEDKGGKSFGPIPPGNYNVECLDAEMTTIDRGQYINLKWAVTDGEHEGQWIWDKVFVEGGYYDNHAENDLKYKLARIVKYSGIGAIKKDVNELLDAKVSVKVVHKPNANNPDKPHVNIDFYNATRKGGSVSAPAQQASPTIPAQPSAPSPANNFGADLGDEPPF